jgi:hypothetical protein
MNHKAKFTGLFLLATAAATTYSPPQAAAQSPCGLNVTNCGEYMAQQRARDPYAGFRPLPPLSAPTSGKKIDKRPGKAAAPPVYSQEDLIDPHRDGTFQDPSGTSVTVQGSGACTNIGGRTYGLGC